MSNRGYYYIVADYMIVINDNERIDGYGRMWHRLFNDPNAIAAYCKALDDCGYEEIGDDEV